MTARTWFGRVQRLLAVAVLLWSGAYLLVYLYRWEWNRAIISGILFVAAELALATSLLFGRLRSIQAQLDAGEARSRPERRTGIGGRRDRLRAAPVDRPDPFRWLSDGTPTGVFVPVLLGAGVILSALAYVVERLAEATAAPRAERLLADRLGAIAPAPGGLLAPSLRSPRPPSRTPDARRRAMVPMVMAAVAVGLLGWLAVDQLLDATQSRPDAAPRPASTVIVIDVRTKGPGRDALDTTMALWTMCRTSLSGDPTIDARARRIAGPIVALELRPGTRRLDTRRLTGCLSDAGIDRVDAQVIRVRHEVTP